MWSLPEISDSYLTIKINIVISIPIACFPDILILEHEIKIILIDSLLITLRLNGLKKTMAV